jgi:hypothetical protein
VSTELVLSSIAPSLPALAVFQGPAQAGRRFWEFFTTQISNDNTRKAYFNAVRHFSAWCQSRNIGEIGQVEPMHIAAYLEVLEKETLSAPTIKQPLAAIRMLFDWLVVGHVLPVIWSTIRTTPLGCAYNPTSSKVAWSPCSVTESRCTWIRPPLG